MTNFCDSLKEIAITMEQIPSNRGYPGDLYSQLAARYEKAVDFDGAGSITILGVTTMPGDDVTHPVPDNTGYITEGQFYLKNGRIEPFGSLSRLKQQVNDDTRSDHRPIMDTMIRMYADYLINYSLTSYFEHHLHQNIYSYQEHQQSLSQNHKMNLLSHLLSQMYNLEIDEVLLLIAQVHYHH